MSGPDLFSLHETAPVHFMVSQTSVARNEQPLIENTNLKNLSSLLSQYDFKWPAWPQVFTEGKEIKGFLFLPTVLAHTASHLETLFKVQGKGEFTF